MKRTNSALLLALMATLSAPAQRTAAVGDGIEREPYEWQSVPIVGGGFVPGIIFSQSAQEVRYCRTDMGGAYRWNAQLGEWEQLLDFLSINDSNLQGVESIAIDPNDADHVMMACGTYTRTPGAIFVTHDGFKSCVRNDVPFGFGGNEGGRGNGERMSISPHNPAVAFIGTRNDGLWRTQDDGRSWQKVASFPQTKENERNYWNRGSGIICTLFHGSDIYAAASAKEQESLFVSHDGGDTWQAVAGQPTKWRPTHMVLSADGKLYISYADTPGPSDMKDGALFVYDTEKKSWRDITPYRPKGSATTGFGYAAVSVDRQNPKTLIASTHGLWGKYGFGGEELFLTQDGGKHWTPVFNHGHRYDCSIAPYTSTVPLHWLFDVEIDPFDPQHAMITTGFGGWETFNLLDCQKRDGTVVWQLMAKGIEETVPLELYSPTTGPRLLVGIGDYGSFTFDDITRVVPTGSNREPLFGNTDGITGAWLRPQLAVRVGEVSRDKNRHRSISYSQDGGHTWSDCETAPDEKARKGSIALSALGTSWIWTPERMAPHRTTDGGKTWSRCQGLPDNCRVVADRANDSRFYAVDVVGRLLYVSNDGGATFHADTLRFAGKQMPMRQGPMSGRNENRGENRGDARGGQDRVYATPGHEGDLWIAAYDGLYNLQLSDDDMAREGALFVPQSFSQVRNLYAFGFGRGLSDSYPSIYIIGVVNGTYGFFRSDDRARSWVKINDDMHQYGLVLQIIGDMQEYGRVYIGTHGRGVITGQAAGR